MTRGQVSQRGHLRSDRDLSRGPYTAVGAVRKAGGSRDPFCPGHNKYTPLKAGVIIGIILNILYTQLLFIF